MNSTETAGHGSLGCQLEAHIARGINMATSPAEKENTKKESKLKTWNLNKSEADRDFQNN
ncbi:hypothetical protein N7475_006575 [Penicillium sp. IBT 31633x]|nr:hypothetical protein N7475_006575 [Penicillium sp. IBT 31633x]